MSEIKVGSEWVSENGERAKVDYVGAAFAVLIIDGILERAIHLSDFIKEYKPAPVRRTVWLNVYKHNCLVHYSKESADKYKYDVCLFQQEVELIDPSEGEKG